MWKRNYVFCSSIWYVWFSVCADDVYTTFETCGELEANRNDLLSLQWWAYLSPVDFRLCWNTFIIVNLECSSAHWSICELTTTNCVEWMMVTYSLLQIIQLCKSRTVHTVFAHVVSTIFTSIQAGIYPNFVALWSQIFGPTSIQKVNISCMQAIYELVL